MDYFKLSVAILVCLLVGGISGIFTTGSVDSWYKTLEKPSFNPPSWIFSPVWTTLYILMGISLYLVWKNYHITKKSRTAIIFFGVQLFLNFSWSIIFFVMHNLLLAVIELIILLIFIILTAIRFYPISKTATYLLIPYILWVSFAGILNLSIYLLNS